MSKRTEWTIPKRFILSSTDFTSMMPWQYVSKLEKESNVIHSLFRIGKRFIQNLIISRFQRKVIWGPNSPPPFRADCRSRRRRRNISEIIKIKKRKRGNQEIILFKTLPTININTKNHVSQSTKRKNPTTLTLGREINFKKMVDEI